MMYEVMISNDNPQCTNIKIARTMTFDDASESVSQRSGCLPCQCQLERYNKSVILWLPNTFHSSSGLAAFLVCSSHGKAIAASNDLILTKHSKGEKTSLRLMQEAPSSESGWWLVHDRGAKMP